MRDLNIMSPRITRPASEVEREHRHAAAFDISSRLAQAIGGAKSRELSCSE